ncbi:hypothetical protein FDF74_10485 [Clostridium niameyense]|uniref:Uncharacterized protein n=1 Tax=Clostridium niameyense TaxID=1622073 RepID=A0A6M0RCT7_9CLOT|nr:hypothetical protein [Clostridium niameyense]NEZ47617.1 hypothetical protein [Clostridium niameyense]
MGEGKETISYIQDLNYYKNLSKSLSNKLAEKIVENIELKSENDALKSSRDLWIDEVVRIYFEVGSLEKALKITGAERIYELLKG